jgi:hypothetical protein
MDLQQRIESTTISTDEISARTHEIYETVLLESPRLDAGNFTVVHSDDVERLFDLYDRQFFDGGCRKLLGNTPLGFRLSKRMTQAAGKAARRELRRRDGAVVRTDYEIAVSTTLLYQTFQDEESPILLSGIPCRDRLEALQRVLEHETVHLIEMLLWTQSSCSAPRFQSIANRFFGHTEHRHQLITPRQRAFTEYGIRSGDTVSFRFEGRHYIGRVNRITKRATILVEDTRGPRYSDGKKYKKYYVPVPMLRRVESL